MTLYIPTYRPRRSIPLVTDEARERTARRRVAIAWGLLFLNTLGYSGMIIHIPNTFGKLITQAALPLAILMALTANRKLAIRPNVFLCLVLLLAVGTILTATQATHIGSLYRILRFIGFIVALWLLTPWWGTRDFFLVRVYLRVLIAVLISVIAGLIVAPGLAFTTGRLAGALWNIPSTQVGHYSAVTVGLTVVLWLCGQLPNRRALLIVSVATVMLVLTHTRTALVALVAGLLVAGLSLVAAKARVRRTFAIVGVVVTIAVMTVSGFITTWLARGQGADQIGDLTGRTLVWGPLLAFPRDRFQEIFGFGLSNASFNGLPIDSNWLSSYQEQGLYGVTICGLILLFLLITAYFQTRGVHRALSLFLTTYCFVASFTEDGFTDASPYLLELTLAASLIVLSAQMGDRDIVATELDLT
jgi:hypothetical protein